MDKVLKVRKRLGPARESKGYHGFCQPASLSRILIAAFNFSSGNLTPTLSARLGEFGKEQYFSRLSGCKLGTIFANTWTHTEDRRAKKMEEERLTDFITEAAGFSHA